LADRLDELIQSTDLRDGERLPPEREMAVALEVSRSTVVSCLDLLRQRGSVKSRQGSGTVVRGPAPANQHPSDFRTRSLFESYGQPSDFTKACPAMLAEVDELMRRLMADGMPISGNMDPEGTPELRQALADWYSDQGLATEPDEIAVTSGAQQGVALTLSVLCRPGDVVLVEACTWPGMTDSINRLGGRAIGVTMDANGIDTAELRSAVERFRPVAIALNPHHHNPTATRLSPRRRAEVAQISADYRAPVIEDRVAALLAFDGVVPKPLAAERADAPIIVADSLSKVLWPGLRLGWVRAPRSVMAEFRLAKAIHDLYTSNLNQALGLAFLGELESLLPDRCAQLETHRDAALEALASALPEWRTDRPPGGMVLWSQLPSPVARPFVRHAAAHGVLIAQADAFSVEGEINDRLRIPFTDSPAVLEENIARMGEAWRTFDPDAAAGPSPTRRTII